MASACGECKKKYNKIARFLAEGGGVFSFECLGLSSSASLGVLGSLCGSMRWPVVRDPCPVDLRFHIESRRSYLVVRALCPVARHSSWLRVRNRIRVHLV